MALNKKGGFGVDLEEQFKNVPSVGEVEPASTPTSTPAQTSTSTSTSTSTQTSTPKKENRSKRAYITTRPSMFAKLEQFAEATERSVNDLVNEAIEDFIAKHGL